MTYLTSENLSVQATAVIKVDLDRTIGEVDPYIYGDFLVVTIGQYIRFFVVELNQIRSYNKTQVILYKIENYA